MTHLTDKILKGSDEGLLTGMILIDLQKAFDTMNHKVLLQKLEAIGFSQNKVLGGLGPAFVTEHFGRN